MVGPSAPDPHVHCHKISITHVCTSVRMSVTHAGNFIASQLQYTKVETFFASLSKIIGRGENQISEATEIMNFIKFFLKVHNCNNFGFKKFAD